MTYINPESRWTFGVGRMYLPWASSLQTIDGGYAAAKTSDRVTMGVFGGSTPDPTAWNYDPNRRIGGAFVNLQGGSFENFWYSSTAGGGMSFLGTTIDRPFVFTENTFSYKRVFSLYHSMQLDHPKTNPGAAPVSTGLGQSFLSARFTPVRRITFDLNHTYFRDVPTYDPQLVGTGLLDKYLFQGFSAGARVEFPLHLIGYASLGQNSNSTDGKTSLNRMYGLTLDKLWRTGVLIDARYSVFNSSFADGTYRSVSFSRNFGEAFRWNMQLGQQSFTSSYSKDTGGEFVNSYLDMILGAHYFLESGLTIQRGATENYNQWTTTIGYRFNNRSRRKEGALANPKH